MLLDTSPKVEPEAGRPSEAFFFLLPVCWFSIYTFAGQNDLPNLQALKHFLPTWAHFQSSKFYQDKKSENTGLTVRFPLFRAIRVSWLSFALPCLLMTYCGQAAFISEHPDAVANPLFKAAPPGTFWPTLILSMMTSIVASQAMLTGTFQLISQAINMSFLPKIRAVHTSSRITSQIYIPMANWVMMTGSLGVTIMYKNVRSRILLSLPR